MDENIRAYIDERINRYLYLIPDHMHGAVKRYIFDRIEPGGFLMAVLSNDLRGAIIRADHENKKNLANLIEFCVAALPVAAWGSEEKIIAWLSQNEDQKNGSE